MNPMIHRTAAALCSIALWWGASFDARAADIDATPPKKATRISTPEDAAAIGKVLSDFMSAIAAKNGKQLSTLILHSRILFTSPGDQARVDSAREVDVHFDGVGVGGFAQFSRYVSTTPDKISEIARNVEITQDGHLAWVLFDYEFHVNDKLSNYGVEAWQLRKTDGAWKIFSVVWTQHEPARP